MNHVLELSFQTFFLSIHTTKMLEHFFLDHLKMCYVFPLTLQNHTHIFPLTTVPDEAYVNKLVAENKTNKRHLPEGDWDWGCGFDWDCREKTSCRYKYAEELIRELRVSVPASNAPAGSNRKGSR